MRKGLGKGQGKGYRNIIGRDPHVHRQSARGLKQPQHISVMEHYTPAPVLSQQEIDSALMYAQQKADERFKEMIGQGAQFEVVNQQTGERFPMLGGGCGFAWIHFKGVKDANALRKMGFEVSKSYYGGFDLSSNRLELTAPDWAVKANPEARAYYGQDMGMKEVALRAFLERMQAKGLLKEAYVDTRLD
jgi:hypothetical protein